MYHFAGFCLQLKSSCHLCVVELNTCFVPVVLKKREKSADQHQWTVGWQANLQLVTIYLPAYFLWYIPVKHGLINQHIKIVLTLLNVINSLTFI